MSTENSEILAIPPGDKSSDQSTVSKVVQIVTVTDPVTGKSVKQIMQTVIDPHTGELKQQPLPSEMLNDNLENGLQFQTYFLCCSINVFVT